jgi:hypothetical protein
MPILGGEQYLFFSMIPGIYAFFKKSIPLKLAFCGINDTLVWQKSLSEPKACIKYAKS